MHYEIKEEVREKDFYVFVSMGKEEEFFIENSRTNGVDSDKARLILRDWHQ